MEKLLVATDLLPEAKKKLQPIVDKRREVAKIDERVDGLVRQRQQLDQRASETRANLLSIEKNQTAAALRAKLTKMLDDFASEGNRIGKEIVELETKRLEHRIELEDLLQNLELVAPPKPKK
jgi:phage shock protein A